MTLATRTTAILMLGLVSLGFLAEGVAQQVGEAVTIREAVNQDLYAAGQSVSVEAPVNGDAVLAGNIVVVTGDVSEDVIAAGRIVTINGAVGDDARLAGQTVTLNGSVAGHAVMAGNEARVDANSRIDDWLWIAAGSVYIAGSVGGELKAAGGDVDVTGKIGGDADIAGQNIRIGDGAVINGNLTWRGETEPVISDGAVITGQIIKGPGFEPEETGGGAALRVFFALSLIIAAGALYTMLRGDCDACAATLQARPAICLLTGLAVFATTPLVVTLLFATGVGALLGVVLLLAYGLALILGALTGVLALARLGLQWLRRDEDPTLWMVWAAIAVVAILLALLGPLGFVVNVFLMFFGLGALSLEAYRRV